MDNNLEKRKNQLRNMKQNQKLTETELTSLAQSKIDEETIVNNLSFCIDDAERKYATELLNRYLSQSSFENESDKELLKQLLDQHLLAERFKSIMKTDYAKSNPAQSTYLVESLDKVVDRIVKLQEKLGLVRKDNGANDVSQVIRSLTDRFHKWINRPENRSNYECQCPECKTLILIRRRLDKEKDQVIEHPWYIDGGVTFNKEIFKDYDLGKISKDQVARYHHFTLDYVDWIKVNYPINQDKESSNDD